MLRSNIEKLQKLDPKKASQVNDIPIKVIKEIENIIVQ